ncbi:MAG TPA: hypothetical protein VFJ72_14260 [Rubrobacteraceae bacterium]|nr:hypothetical protein [Rubrobacteraceae bacterium]
MKKIFGRLVLLGALVGGAVALGGYLKKSGPSGEEVVQITFDDNTTQSLPASSMESQEFTDIARKLVGMGV